MTADAEGNATIPSRVVDSRLKVWNFIGRSLAHDAERLSRRRQGNRGGARSKRGRRGELESVSVRRYGHLGVVSG